MPTEARSQGQAAATGGATKNRNGRQIAEPVRLTTARRRNGSPPCLTRAFQAACNTAAPRTMQKVKDVTRPPELCEVIHRTVITAVHVPVCIAALHLITPGAAP